MIGKKDAKVRSMECFVSGACGIRTRGLCNADAALWPAELTPLQKTNAVLTDGVGNAKVKIYTMKKSTLLRTGDGTRTRARQNLPLVATCL